LPTAPSPTITHLTFCIIDMATHARARKRRSRDAFCLSEEAAPVFNTTQFFADEQQASTLSYAAGYMYRGLHVQGGRRIRIIFGTLKRLGVSGYSVHAHFCEVALE
jgi:hypothetical protein